MLLFEMAVILQLVSLFDSTTPVFSTRSSCKVNSLASPAGEGLMTAELEES